MMMKKMILGQQFQNFISTNMGVLILSYTPTDKKFLTDSDIPSCYKDILFSFLDLKSLYNSEDEQEMILFHNKEILVDRRTVFYDDCVEKGVFTVHDVTDAHGSFLPFELFQQRHGINCNFFKYFQVIFAILSTLREKKPRSMPSLMSTFYPTTPYFNYPRS